MERIRILLILAAVFCSLGLLFFVIGYSTPYWLQTDDRHRARSGFQKLGLWTACFEDWSYYKDYLGKQYFGCWWIFSYEFRPLWKWMNPEWLLTVQVMMTLTLMLEIVTLALIFWYIFKKKTEHIGVLSLAGLATLSGFIVAPCISLFATYSVVDRQWIENPSKTFLSWSFGLTVLSGFLTVFGGMCLGVAGMDSREIAKKNRKLENSSKMEESDRKVDRKETIF